MLKYGVFCEAAIGGTAILAVVLWSDMGWGFQNLEALHSWSDWSTTLMGFGLFMLALLYVVDFYVPPHLPYQFLTLGPADRGQGRVLFLLAILSILGGAVVSVSKYPHLPLFMTIFLAPGLLAIYRNMVTHKAQFKRRHSILSDANAFRPEVQKQQTETMQAIHGEESDVISYYSAAAVCFIFTGCCCFVFWTVWAFTEAQDAGFLEGTHQRREKSEDDTFGQTSPTLHFLLFYTPPIVGASMLAFACIVMLRVYMHQGYTSTDEYKHELWSKMTKTTKDADRAKKALSEMRTKSVAQMTRVVKLIVCVFFFFLSILWLTADLATAEFAAMQTVKIFVGAMFLAFIGFLYTALARLWSAISDMLKGTPLYRTGVAIKKSDWSRAILVFISSCFVPFFLLLSCINQFVRVRRNLYGRIPVVPQRLRAQMTNAKSAKKERMWSQLAERSQGYFCEEGAPRNAWKCEQEKHFLTEKVHLRYMQAMTWQWSSVLAKVHWLGIIYFSCSVGTYKAMNIFLAWLNLVLTKLGMPFAALIGVYYLMGLICFLLPPVPGPPVYLFGGLVVVRQCPWGFMWGTLGCIFICWTLKLVACTMQQKCIGEMLGHSDKVRQMCGVNTPSIKAIEMVLRRPGMSVGKCAILCGGPDWPTSVGAGILKLPLHEMILGTTPIILFVAPCVCTGSFYLRRQESPIWMRSASLMLTSTLIICCILWIAAAWEIQNTLDKNYDVLSRSKPEHAHLDWLSHRSKLLKNLQEEHLQWEKLPCIGRGILVCGATMMVISCQIFYWMDASCFGEFHVTSSIDTLDWGYVKPPGLLGLFFFFSSIFCFYFFSKWTTRRIKPLVSSFQAQLDAQETTWKEEQRNADKNNTDNDLETAEDGSGMSLNDTADALPQDTQLDGSGSDFEVGEEVKLSGVELGQPRVMVAPLERMAKISRLGELKKIPTSSRKLLKPKRTSVVVKSPSNCSNGATQRSTLKASLSAASWKTPEIEAALAEAAAMNDKEKGETKACRLVPTTRSGESLRKSAGGSSMNVGKKKVTKVVVKRITRRQEVAL